MTDNADAAGIEPEETQRLPRTLSMTDAVAIIVGIVVGTAIFKAPPLVFGNVSSASVGLWLWVVGGGLSLLGACCYAELATAYPHSGGDYHYLTAAFGRPVGFLFGWAQLSVILTASIAQMAYVFADYAGTLISLSPAASLGVAAGVVFLLTMINLLGISSAKWTQNVLALAKIIGLVGIVVAGLVLTWGMPMPEAAPESAGQPPSSAIGLALVFVLYAFGGWNDTAFVAAEVREPERNLPRSLWIGIGLITGLYVLVNLAYLRGLGFAGLRESAAPAAELLDRTTGFRGMTAMSCLVMISAAGAINGMILTGARVYARLGEDHAMFRSLGGWNHRLQTPSRALWAQAAVAVAMIWLVGSTAGRHTVDWVAKAGHVVVVKPVAAVCDALGSPAWGAALRSQGLRDGLPWERYYGGFDTLVAGTAPVFWLFFLGTGIAFFVLRVRDKGRRRPIRVPWFPVPPLAFCGMCVYMLVSSLQYAQGIAVIGFVPLLVGVPMYFVSQRLARRPRRRSGPES